MQTTKGHQRRRKGHSGREPHHGEPSSQKRFNVDFQGGAGHVQLKFGDNIRMKNTQLANALTPGKDFSTSPREESRACKTERGKSMFLPANMSIDI